MDAFASLGLTLTDLIYFKLDTQGRQIANQFAEKSKQADSNGVYTSNIAIANLYVDVSF